MLNVHESSSIKSNPKTICWHGSGSELTVEYDWPAKRQIPKMTNTKKDKCKLTNPKMTNC